MADGCARASVSTIFSKDSGGWFHTGDLAQRDEDGFFDIAGRLKDMIISGGVNIYPAEIEAELLRHEAVTDAAIVGIADEKWREVPIAFLVVKAEHKVSSDDMTAFLGKRLSKIKLPRRFISLDTLPRNVYGKVLKNELRATFLANDDRTHSK